MNTIPSTEATNLARLLAVDAQHSPAHTIAMLTNNPSFIANLIQETINKNLAALFATMPEPPTDMGELDGIMAFAEAVLEWRAKQGFPY